jgi:Zinc carboxypeptidase
LITKLYAAKTVPIENTTAKLLDKGMISGSVLLAKPISDSFLSELAQHIKTSPSSPSAFKLAGSGPISGYYDYSQLCQLLAHLHTLYPQLVSPLKSIGHTFANNQIQVAEIADTSETESQDGKNIVLIDGAIHARELVAGTMAVHTAIELVRAWNAKLLWAREFLRSHRVIILPVINVDGYDKITSAYGTSTWHQYRLIRKNLRGFEKKCPGSDFGGVDLNRNFDFDFPPTSEIPDPCDQEFAGRNPFSEPETQAVRDLILSNKPYIVSALNFHSYGFMWDYPLNSQKKRGQNQLRTLNPKMFRKYRLFERDYLPNLRSLKYGNAMDTVGYFARGEATDWMVLKQGLFAFSPELGDETQESSGFQTSIPSQRRIVDTNFEVVRKFFQFHIPRLAVLSINEMRHYIKSTKMQISTATCFSVRFDSHFSLQSAKLQTNFNFDRSYLNSTMMSYTELPEIESQKQVHSQEFKSLDPDSTLTLCSNNPLQKGQEKIWVSLTLRSSPNTPLAETKIPDRFGRKQQWEYERVGEATKEGAVERGSDQMRSSWARWGGRRGWTTQNPHNKV